MMTLHLRRHLAAWSLLLLVHVHLTHAMETTTKPASDEDDSSSEETVEDSSEKTARRRRRSAELSDASEDIGNGNNNGLPNNNNGLPNNNNGKSPRAGLPGLPDPATVLKIAEILQTVGEKVIPILIQGNEATAAIAQRLGQQFQFLNTFRREIDQFAQSLGSIEG